MFSMFQAQVFFLVLVFGLVCLVVSLPGSYQPSTIDQNGDVHQAVTSDKNKLKIKFCKLENLIECFAEPNMYFTAQENGTGIPRNENELEQFCFNQHDYAPYCAVKWLQRCGNDVYVEIAKKMFLEPMRQSVWTFCDPNGPIRPKFIKIVECLIEKVKLAPDYRATCIRDIQAGFEWIHENMKKHKNLSQMIRGICCTYNRWENCMVDQLNRKCGQAAGEVFPYMIHTNSLDLLKSLCIKNAFNANDPDQCNPKEFLAPPDFVPKGIQSNATGSFYFSYFCPNVGFGIDPSRDF